MANYRVYEVFRHDGRPVEIKVYEGEVAPEILAGKQTLQVSQGGRRYHKDGYVLYDGCRERVRGLKCRFEPVTP